MILSALDSGKIFYNKFFSKNISEESCDLVSSYIIRIFFGLLLGWISIIVIQQRSKFEIHITLLSLCWLLVDRTFDEIQRYYISKKEYPKWSKLQIIKALFIIMACPLLILSNKHLSNLLVTLIFLFPGLLIFIFYINQKKHLLITAFKFLRKDAVSVVYKSFADVKSILTGFLGASLTLPKNIVLLFCADALINESHNVLNICSIQSFYIFGFYIVDKRWKILQDKESVHLVNRVFLTHICVTLIPILLIIFLCMHLNILSHKIIVFFPFIFLSECLFNINGVQRDILYYLKKSNDLMAIDLFIIILFLIMFTLVYLFNNHFLIGLSLIVIIESLRAYLYKNEFCK